MALSPITVVCSKCQNKFTDVPKRSFLGFQKINCPECKEKLTFPLTDGYRVIYWVILFSMALQILVSLNEGNFIFPGLLSFAIVFALIRDRTLKKGLIINKSYE